MLYHDVFNIITLLFDKCLLRVSGIWLLQCNDPITSGGQIGKQYFLVRWGEETMYQRPVQSSNTDLARNLLN